MTVEEAYALHLQLDTLQGDHKLNAILRLEEEGYTQCVKCGCFMNVVEGEWLCLDCWADQPKHIAR